MEKYRSNRHLAYDYTVDGGITNLTFHDHRLCCVKIVNQFQCMQFSVILGVYKDCLSVETRETRHIVGRRASVCATRFFHRRRIKFAFFGCGYLSGMEGDGDLMKMLMHADPPDENIQGPMEDTAMVQTGV